MSALYDAVLFDRDGTLIVDVPYNGDPALVQPMPGARAALDRLRAAGLRVGVVTNQSGLARGRFSEAQLAAVNARVEELLGPFDTWQICPHDDAARCRCRKPAPGLITAAAAALGRTPDRCVVVGDIGRDMTAAVAAGATGILVPTPITLPAEIAAAPAVAAGLTAAADLILQRMALVTAAPRPLRSPGSPRRPEDQAVVAAQRRPEDQAVVAAQRRPEDQAAVAAQPGTVLVVRADAAGDVLLTGPAIRAVAAGADRLVLLCGPRGRAAAELLPGVDEIVEYPLPWIEPRPRPVDAAGLADLTARLAAVRAEEAVVFTSFHQSALPLALLLRAAGVARITAISDDYPGALLDVRHHVPAGTPEAERALSVAAAAGFALPPGDDGRLRVMTPPPARRGGYLVVHPGASVGARACPPEVLRRIVAALLGAGYRVLVSAGPGELALARYIGGEPAGPTSMAELAGLIAGADCLVAGNTGPAHLAAAVGTPVVSLYAPTVPYGQWGPYRVPAVRLGDAAAPCRDTRATTCPVPGHPCLAGVDPRAVVDAVRLLGVTEPVRAEEVAA